MSGNESFSVPTFQEIVTRRYSRRGVLDRMMKTSAVGAIAATGSLGLAGCSDGREAKEGTSLSFQEIPHLYDATHHVADGYSARVLLKWGDPIIGQQGIAFDPQDQSAAAQERQFGYNNDFLAYMPFPLGTKSSDHGLLVANHEFPTAHLMFPGIEARADSSKVVTRNQVNVEMAALGLSVVEIKLLDGQWTAVSTSSLNRRITANTEIEITGPLAGHSRLKTNADATGTRVLGTMGNCAGGVTPWGTILTAEENFQGYFWGNRVAAGELAPEEVRNYEVYGVGYSAEKDASGKYPPASGAPWFGWGFHHDRFNIEKEPREPNRFGYLVEFDPYSPKSQPKKRTALGRFKHEGATVVTKRRSPVVVYSGDDERFQHIYRFVSRDAYQRNKSADILDDGDLYAAKFFADGTGKWIKLHLGKGGADGAALGLASETEVYLEPRVVAKSLGATPMDRPEDMGVDPNTDRLYVTLTNNSKLTAELANPANPREKNLWGHILEISPPGEDGKRDHTSDEFEWEIFLLAGDPGHPQASARGSYHPGVTDSGWFQNPDNLEFDPKGRLWIASDGFPSHKSPDGTPAPVHDGLWATETTGPNRALPKHFYGCPRGAEMCGPTFTPDGKSLFVAVQHPGMEPGATFDKPATRWPDFKAGMPPRPSVVAITKDDGGEIGS